MWPFNRDLRTMVPRDRAGLPPHPTHPRVSPGEQVGPEWKVLDFLDAAEKCLRDLRTQAAG